MDETDRLPDQWESRDRPALMQFARHFANDAGIRQTSNPAELAAVVALTPAYLDARMSWAGNGEPYVAVIRGLTERGRREAGLWPNQEASAEALIDLLAQAADQTEDEEDASALRRAGRLLQGVPAAVVGQVTAALVRQQMGLP